MDTIIKFTKENYAELDVQKLDGGTVTVTSPVIIRIDGDTIKTLGTAFCVGLTQAGVGIYITARHVIDVLTSYPEGYEPFVLIAEKVNHPQIGNYGYGRIQQICVVNQPSDLALFAADLSHFPHEKLPSKLALNFSEPNVGLQVLALGYPKLITGEIVSKDEFEHRWRASIGLSASQGTVEEVHPTMRDGAVITFPSMLLNTEFKHGMSGGPIVSADGKGVIGVVSSGFEHGEPGLSTSYGASIVPILEFNLELDLGHGAKVFTVSDLITNGVFRSSGQAVMRRGANTVSIGWIGK